jgi:ADP-heptose:LPS heptosyltransferase
MPKVLIIRFSSIGDIILTTPVIRAIKQQVKGVELHYCTKKSYAVFMQHNPYIDKLHYLEDDLSKLATALRAEKYDYIIDLHNNLRTLRLKFLIGAYSWWGKSPEAVSFNKLNIEKWLYVNLKKADAMPNVHIVDRYMDAAQTLGVVTDNQGLDFFIPATANVALSSLPPTHQNGYVAYAIGGQHSTKQMPLHKIIELCEKINRPIVLLGDKNDAIVGEKVALHFNNLQKTHPKKQTIIYNACGLYNLNESASLLQQAHTVFTHDTGLMHIAAALKKNIYSIWGNTTPLLGMYPYQTNYKVIENNNLSCRPCSKIGFDKCPKGHFKCMNDLQFDNIVL